MRGRCTACGLVVFSRQGKEPISHQRGAFGAVAGGAEDLQVAGRVAPAHGQGNDVIELQVDLAAAELFVPQVPPLEEPTPLAHPFPTLVTRQHARSTSSQIYDSESRRSDPFEA